jgi:Flp pilus assembly protein TadG
MIIENLRRYARSFGRDDRGAAAVEFGVLAPVMLLMLLGTIEGGRAVNVDRHFSSVVATAGDLVAREEYLGTSTSTAKGNLDGMARSIEHLMLPYDASALKIGIFSVQASTADETKTKVVWSYSPDNHQMPDLPAKCSSYALPKDLVGKGGSVIVVEAKYNFIPLFGDYVPGFGSLGEFKDKTFHSPRNSCVDYVKGDNCTNSC